MTITGPGSSMIDPALFESKDGGLKCAKRHRLWRKLDGEANLPRMQENISPG